MPTYLVCSHQISACPNGPRTALLVPLPLHLRAAYEPVDLHLFAHVFLEANRALVVHSVLGIVCAAVVEDTLRVVEERVRVGVLIRLELVFHRAEVCMRRENMSEDEAEKGGR